MDQKKFERITNEINSILIKENLKITECIAIIGQMATHAIQICDDKEGVFGSFIRVLSKTVFECDDYE